MTQHDREWQEQSFTCSFCFSTSSFRMSSSLTPALFASTDSRGFAAPKGFCEYHLSCYTSLYTFDKHLHPSFNLPSHRFATRCPLGGSLLRSGLITGFQNKPTPLSDWFICPWASHSDFGLHAYYSRYNFFSLQISLILSCEKRPVLLDQTCPRRHFPLLHALMCQIWILLLSPSNAPRLFTGRCS